MGAQSRGKMMMRLLCSRGFCATTLLSCTISSWVALERRRPSEQMCHTKQDKMCLCCTFVHMQWLTLRLRLETRVSIKRHLSENEIKLAPKIIKTA